MTDQDETPADASEDRQLTPGDSGGDNGDCSPNASGDSSDVAVEPQLERSESGGPSRQPTTGSWLTTPFSWLLPKFIRRKYLLKFGFALILVIIVITVVGVLAFDDTTATLDKQISTQLKGDAERESQRIGDWYDQRSLWVNDLSRIHAGRNLSDPIELTTQLQEDADVFPDDVLTVHQINLSSTEVTASTDTTAHGTVLLETDTPWATRNLTRRLDDSNDIFVSGVYRDTGRPVIAFVTEIPETQDAGLVAIVQPNVFFTEVAPEEGRYITVVNTQTGDIAMASRLANSTQIGDEIIGQQYGTDDTIAEISATDSPRYLGLAPNQEDFEQRYVAASARINQTALQRGTNIEKRTDYVVVVHAREDEVFAVRQAIVSRLILLIGVSLVGLTLIGLVIAGGTVRSINRLARQVEELERGNLDIEFRSGRIDEIGQLYDGFESMRVSLQHRIEELSEAMEAEERMRKELTETNENLKNQRIIISVLNRLLRHNLRNSLTSILLRMEMLSDNVSGKQQAEVQEIFGVTERLIHRVEKSQAIEKIIDTDPEKLGTVDISDTVQEAAQIQQEEWPEATVETDLEERAFVNGGDGISFIVDNLLENAIEHNDKAESQVWVTVQTVTEDDSQWVELEVEDNGPGIPEMETKVLESGRETPLEHGSGIGLWLVNWLVEHLNGNLVFDDRTPRGTRVVVRFPKTDEPVME